MSSKTLEGMVRAYEDGFLSSTGSAHTRADAMRAVLLWLADNISDEMVEAAWRTEFSRGGFDDPVWRRSIKSAISAALRAAGDGR
jgi:hypothetical protein